MKIEQDLDGSVPSKTSRSILPQILALNNITEKASFNQGGNELLAKKTLRWVNHYKISLILATAGLTGLYYTIANHAGVPIDTSGPTRPNIAAAIIPPEQLNTPQQEVKQIISVEKTTETLLNLNQKIDAIYQMRGSWTEAGTPYHVQKGDTLTSVAEKYKTTPDKLLQLNNLSAIYPHEGEIFAVPINPEPAPHIVKVFNEVKSKLAELEKIKQEKGENSAEAKTLADSINTYLHTTPNKSSEVKAPEIDVDSNVKNSDFIISQIKKLNSYLPNIGRVVDKFVILPRDPSYPYPSGTYTFPNKGADIEIFDTPSNPDRNGNQEQWTERWLLLSIFHEENHALDPYEPFAASFFTSEELINNIYEDTEISNMTYLVYPRTSRVTIPNEARAQEGESLLITRPSSISLSPDRELEKKEFDFANKRLSIILEPKIPFAQIGQELGLQP